MVFGAEILPSENFIIRAGYNYQRRQELKFSERPGMVGLVGRFWLENQTFQSRLCHFAVSPRWFVKPVFIGNKHQ
jgi:hypothetical protein